MWWFFTVITSWSSLKFSRDVARGCVPIFHVDELPPNWRCASVFLLCSPTFPNPPSGSQFVHGFIFNEERRSGDKTGQFWFIIRSWTCEGLIASSHPLSSYLVPLHKWQPKPRKFPCSTITKLRSNEIWLIDSKEPRLILWLNSERFIGPIDMSLAWPLRKSHQILKSHFVSKMP